MKKMKNFFIFFLLVCIFIKLSISSTSLLKYNIDTYESYGTSENGCSVNIGVLFQDQYEIKSFSSIIYGPTKILYEGDKQLYYLTINNVPFNSSKSLPSFTVLNSNDENSTININLSQNYNCKKLYTPLAIENIGNIIASSSSFSIVIKFDKLIYQNFDISQSIKCKISCAKNCYFLSNLGVYTITAMEFNSTGISQLNIQLNFMDFFGGSQLIQLDNPFYNESLPSTHIDSFGLSLPNNSKINTYTDTNMVGIMVNYTQLNSYSIFQSDSGSVYYPKFVLGTPEKMSYYYIVYVFSYGLSTYKYNEYPSKGSNQFIISYSGSSWYLVNFDLKPVRSVEYDEETNNIVFKLKCTIPFLYDQFYSTPIHTVFDINSTTLPYPYGYNKISSNSTWQYNAEYLMLFNKLGGEQSLRFQNYQNLSVPVIIPDFPGIDTNPDTQGPIIHSIVSQQLENNKLLVTMNISDNGSGLYQLVGISPAVTFYAKEALISGDINNGIYQVLGDAEKITLINFPYVLTYDQMGNTGSNGIGMIYSDFNFTPVDSIITPITFSDIKYVKFDRHEIDTSFNDLNVTLSIGYNGANEFSSVPVVTPSYSFGLNGNQRFQGIYNKTTGHFDINIRVQARDSGSFKYSLYLPPLSLDNYMIETVFPTEKVLLTTNYVDHYPPTISSFKSLSNVNLSIAKGEEIEIGWNIQIFDYPVGLDYAYFEVVSSVDFEPWIFEFKPNTSVPGDDILSDYTISFKVKPLVNQTFYISKCKLFDKNGYYSNYPVLTNVESFDAFFANKFTSERNIQVNITSLVPQNYQDDNKAPELLLLAFPSLFDSFGINRTLIFEFTVKDDLSGISLRHNPYIYIQLLYSRAFRVQSQIISSDNSTLTNTYRAYIDLDYSVLAYGAIVSIHGITDNSLNIVSYSSSQLKALGLPSTIVNPIQTRPPVILDFTDLNENGGKLYLYGKEFTNSPIVYMDKGNGFEIITPTFVSNLALTLNIPNVKGINSIKFKVNSKQLDSNIITVIPMVNPIAPNSNCTLLNDCSGKGQCINSQCVCNSGSSGPDCSSTTSDINIKPNETPSIGSFGSMVEINQLDEIDINGNIVNSYPLTSWSSSTIKSQYQLANAYQYVCNLKGTDTNVSVVVDSFDSPTTINFASNTLKMDKGTIKYTISLNSYPFGSRFNTLQLKVNASIEVNNSTCKLNSYSLQEGTNSLEWIKLRSNDKSIYGKFIQSALVDYRSISIQNNLLVVPTYQNQQAVVGIQIPFYYQNAVLDPDFSVLLDSDNLGANKGSSCYGDIVYENDNRLSKSKIITISVICGAVAISLIITSIVLYKKKRSFLRFKNSLQKKNQLN